MHVTPFLVVSRALNAETRLRILLALEAGELCLCQIVELVGLAPSTLSKHVHLLAVAGLVLRPKQGRWHYFRLAGDQAPAEIRQALDWVTGALRTDPVIREDARRLPGVLRQDLRETASCCYRG